MKVKYNSLNAMSKGTLYVWRKRNAEFDEQNTCPTVKHRCGLIMLWPCVTASGTGNMSKVEGIMDSVKFQQILEANFTSSVKSLR